MSHYTSIILERVSERTYVFLAWLLQNRGLFAWTTDVIPVTEPRVGCYWCQIQPIICLNHRKSSCLFPIERGCRLFLPKLLFFYRKKKDVKFVTNKLNVSVISRAESSRVSRTLFSRTPARVKVGGYLMKGRGNWVEIVSRGRDSLPGETES